MDEPFSGCCKENYPLAPETYYRVGGPARLALLPQSAEEARAAYTWMQTQPGPHLVLGRGSNVLIADRGFDGIVLFTGGFAVTQPLGKDRYRIEAGCALEALVEDVIVPNNYEGAGALTGIPGSVGGAVFMNAGTVNGCTGELVESVDLMTPSGPKTFVMDASAYTYRSQTFCGPRDLILSAVFRFRKSERDQRAIHEHYLQRRKEKQPQGYCCGSVFKNPPNDSAGRLIEACGLKGLQHGGAIVSPQHANFIMNEDNATCEDVLWLIGECKRQVRERFDVELHEEVRIIG